MKDKINLYEKLWFGKYMGSRLIDVIDTDIKHIAKMMSEGFMFSDEALEYYNIKSNEKKKERYGLPNRYWDDNPWDNNDQNH